MGFELSTNAKPKRPPPLWKHQKKTVALCKKQPRVLDASDPGTGKTRSHIVAYEHIKKNHGGKCLVIAPKSLLEPAWAEDFASFAPKLTVSVAYAANREEAFEADADVYITNTDAVKWLAKKPKKFFKDFSTLIVDEIQYFKHRTSDRSKALKKIRVYFEFRRGLGATLTANTVCDIWHPMYVIDDGDALGDKFTAFRSAVTTPEQVGPRANHIKWVDKEHAEEAVSDLIKHITIRHQFDEVMDIPENRTHFVTYPLKRKHYNMYKELEKESVLALEEETVTALNAAVLRNKLLQVASGAVYTSENNYEVIDTGRYELIADLIEARSHSVVFFNWTHQRDQLTAHLEKRGVVHCVIDGRTPQKRRNELVKAYQAGFFQSILLHPQTGAHGLTLTKGTSTIWCSPIYQADFLKQGKHRVYRGGQTEATETILVEARNTVERLVYERLDQKTTRMMDFLDLVRANSK